MDDDTELSIEDRLGDLEDRHDKLRGVVLSTVVAVWGIAWAVGHLARRVEIDTPSMSPYWERRLEELQQTMHLHLHPEEITHQ